MSAVSLPRLALGIPAPTPADEPQRGYTLPTAIAASRTLSATAKVVYAVIAEVAGDGGVCRRGQRRIAADAGLGLKAGHRAVHELEAAGLIEVEPGRLDGPPAERTCAYRLRSPSDNVPLATTSGRCRIDNDNVVESTTDINTEEKYKKKKKKRADLSIVAPAERDWTAALAAMTGSALRADEFRAAWDEWREHRRQLHKPLTPATIKKQIRNLERWGLAGALASIDYSIAGGYAGLFEPRPGGGSGQRPADVSRVPAPRGKYDAVTARMAALLGDE